MNETNNIILPRSLVKSQNGVVVFTLDVFQKIQQELQSLRNKVKLLGAKEKFTDLNSWGVKFAKVNKITQKEILEND
ncbi:MAG: hypothetical protein Q8N55_02115 [bacterium]|nr:hypothetical protein [bacterium]